MGEVARKTAWYLRRVPALQRMSEETLNTLIAVSEVRDFKPRHCIYLAGDPAADVYCLHGGRVHTQRVHSVHSLNTGTFRPVSFFGDEGLWGGNVRQDQAVTVTAAIIVAVPAIALRAALDVCPEARALLCQEAVARRDTLVRRMFFINVLPVQARLAAVLLDLASDGTSETEGIRIRVTHEQLAELAGATRETITLDLAVMEQHGLVLRRNRHLYLLNTQGLARLVADPSTRRRKQTRAA